MQSTTVTLQELCRILRDHGISATEKNLAKEIEQGAYSEFASCTRPNGRRKFLILRKPLDEWLQRNTYKGE